MYCHLHILVSPVFLMSGMIWFYKNIQLKHSTWKRKRLNYKNVSLRVLQQYKDISGHDRNSF